MKQQTNPLDCFAAIGFDADKLLHIKGSLTVLSQYLFQPFLAVKPFNLADWHLEKNMKNLLVEKRWWFRSAGPADLLLLMRAFQGLVLQLQQLEVTLNWWDVLYQALGDSLIQQAVNYELPVMPLQFYTKNISFSDQADKLCVQVFENVNTIVSVTLPAEAVWDLKEIIPEDVASQIKNNAGVDLNQILDKLRVHGLVPQTVFEFKNGCKAYKVWLE